MTPAFSAAEFRRRAGLEREEVAGEDWGDHRLNPGSDRLTNVRLRDAAVLVPVVDRGPEASVILTRRSAALRAHSGQISFPGGRIDPGDASAEAAALRETWEEIGLASERIEIVGRMPDYLAGSGYRITPVLGIVRTPFELTLNPDEVDTAFEAPLRFLMDAANHGRSSRFWDEREWFFYDIPFDDQRIWGVTAGIIRTLYERLYQ